MDISITYTRDEGDPRSGPVQIGWLLDTDASQIVYFPPERLRSAEVNRNHAKSASRCPAVLNLESRYVVIRAPFDLHLAFERETSGEPVLRNCLGDKSPVRRSKLKQLVSMTPEPEWRAPDRPIVQLSLPYLFLADEPVYLFKLFEAERTKDLDAYLKAITGAGNYVNQTFSLFDQAKNIRPDRLLTKKP